MSFASDIERGGGGYGQPPAGGRQFGGGGYQGSGFGNGGTGRDDDYNFEKNQVSTAIRDMAARYQQVVDSSSTLGSAGDTVEFRDDLTRRMDEVRDIARQVVPGLRRLATAASSSGSASERKERKLVVDKLSKDFNQFYDKVTSSLAVLKQQMDQTPPQRATSPMGGFGRQAGPSSGSGAAVGYQSSFLEADEDAEKISLIRAAQQQEYYQLEQDAEHNRTIIAEREDAIRRLRSDMQEVHEVFRDLATLVGEQGEMIDNIESNIQQTVAHTKQGVVEIRKAAEYQSKARSKLCCVAIIFAILAGGAVIAVVVWLATKPK